MKWVVRKGGIPPTTEPDEIDCFEEIDLKEKDGSDALDAELKKLGFEEWVKYPGPNNNFEPIKIKGASRKYEVFCGGFLYYHDVEFKKYPKGKGYTDENGYPEWKTYKPITAPNGEVLTADKFEHKIYYDWFKDKEKGQQDTVRIYITKTPGEFNSTPPKPPPPPPPES